MHLRLLEDEVDSSHGKAHLLLCLQAHRPWRDRVRLLSQSQGLQTFLRHVVSEVPFYQNFFKGMPEGTTPPLAAFPLVSRADHLAHRGELTAAAYAEEVRRFEISTSGTTGPPMTFGWDLAGWYDCNVGTYDYLAESIPGLREAVSPGQIGVVLLSNKRHRPRVTLVLPTLKSSLFRYLVLGRDEETDRRLLDFLSDTPIPLLYGKSSYLLDLIRLERRLDPRRRAIRPGAILVSGENLFANHRRQLEAWFACRVYNGYALAEGGFVALECPHRNGLHVRSLPVRIEVLTADGSLKEEGTGEIVLTHLMNWGTPFVRYRTGDRATVRQGACACGYQGKTLTALPGREAVCFESPRGPVATESLDPFFESLPVEQFQVEQMSPTKLCVRWILEPREGPPEPLEEAARSYLRERLGSVEVNFSAEDRLTPLGGKIRRYVKHAPS